MIRFFVIITTCMLCIVAGCTMVAGTASEVEGKYAVRGRVMENSGNPLEGALVRIRPQGYLALNGDASVSLDTITDKEGYFYFDTIPVDSYTIEINVDRKYGALQKLIVYTCDSFPVHLPAVTVSPTGSITGSINLPISDDTTRPWIALYNVDYLMKAPITQVFKFEGIPEGVYSLRIVPFLNSKLVVELHEIEVIANSLTDVGTLNFTIQQFFNGCTSFECDSMAVQSILDSNRITGLSVNSVVVKDTSSGRVIGLNLSDKAIFTIPKNIGSLSQLSTLDLRNNKITSLPEQFGYLKELRECHLDSNQLFYLPDEMVFLCSLKVLTVSNNRLNGISSQLLMMPVLSLDLRFNLLENLPDDNKLFPNIRFLYLDNNNLKSLPNTLMQKNLQIISISNNRLCSLKSTISDWLSSFDSNWTAHQNCSQESLN